MEKKLFAEIPANVFHSAVLTSYSYNNHFFERQAIKELTSKGVFNISVLVDGKMLTEHLKWATISEDLESRSFSLIGMKSQGAFHPKINYFIGDNALMCIIGSGNLTSCGHGKNKEAFTTLFANSKEPQHLEILKEIWNYLEITTASLRGTARNQIDFTRNSCLLLTKDRSTSLAVGKNFYKVNRTTEIAFITDAHKGSLFSSLIASIGKEKIREINVIAPFYDVGGQMLTNLRREYNFPLTKISLQNNYGINPLGLKDLKNLKIFNWDKVSRGLIADKSKEDLVHAKIFIMHGASNQYCLIGSANPSIAAFGTEKSNGINQEASLLLKSRSRNFLKELGIKFEGIKNDELSEFNVAVEKLDLIKTGSNNAQIHILCVEMVHSSLQVFLDAKTRDGKSTLLVLDKNRNVLLRHKIVKDVDEIRISISSVIAKTAQLVVIANDKDEEASNVQLIINSEKIQRHNPSQINRALNRIISVFEAGLTPLSYIEYLGALSNYTTIKSPSSSNSVGKVSTIDRTMVEEDVSHKTYQEFIKEIKLNKNNYNNALQLSYSKLRILDVLLHVFDAKKQLNELVANDMEEMEVVDSSEGREDQLLDEVDPGNLETWIDIKGTRKKIIKLKEIYCNALTSLPVINKSKLDLVDLAEFILIMKLLLDTCDYEVDFEEEGKVLARKDYILPSKFFVENSHSFPMLATSVINVFTTYSNKLNGVEDYIDNEFYSAKMLRYKEIAFAYGASALVSISISNPENAKLDKEIEKWFLDLIRTFKFTTVVKIKPEILDMILAETALSQRFKFGDITDAVDYWIERCFDEYNPNSEETNSGNFRWIKGYGYTYSKRKKDTNTKVEATK